MDGLGIWDGMDISWWGEVLQSKKSTVYVITVIKVWWAAGGSAWFTFFAKVIAAWLWEKFYFTIFTVTATATSFIFHFTSSLTSLGWPYLYPIIRLQREEIEVCIVWTCHLAQELLYAPRCPTTKYRSATTLVGSTLQFSLNPTPKWSPQFLNVLQNS